MNESDVITLYDLLYNNGIDVWIDGGWGLTAICERFNIALPKIYRGRVKEKA